MVGIFRQLREIFVGSKTDSKANNKANDETDDEQPDTMVMPDLENEQSSEQKRKLKDKD